jgi:integrase
MPTIKLTKSSIDAIEPASKDTVYWDDALPGFGLKVTPLGRKVFIVLYRTRDGRQLLRKYTIGRYGPITLQSARLAAQKVLAARLDGRDPAGERRAARKRVVVDTVEQVVSEYVARRVDHSRSKDETTRLLNKEVLSRWKGRSIHQIEKRDVVELLDAIVNRGAPGAANRCFTVVRALFNWCIGRGLLERSPCTGLAKPSVEIARDRVLSDTELAAIINAARAIGHPYGHIVELLALTGQRREEVAGLTWSELDLANRLWTLDGRRTKNGKPHLVHLSEASLDVLARCPENGDYVMAAASSRKFDRFSEMKRELDRSSGVRDWVLHDLRRTMVSGMAKLGVSPHVADKILNHQSGTISGVAAVYQRHQFMEERKQALELWGRHVTAILPVEFAHAA